MESENQCTGYRPIVHRHQYLEKHESWVGINFIFVRPFKKFSPPCGYWYQSKHPAPRGDICNNGVSLFIVLIYHATEKETIIYLQRPSTDLLLWTRNSHTQKKICFFSRSLLNTFLTKIISPQFASTSKGSSVSTLSGLRAGLLTNRSSIPGRNRRFSLLRSAQTGSAVHSASHALAALMWHWPVTSVYSLGSKGVELLHLLYAFTSVQGQRDLPPPIFRAHHIYI
jgi:hypothetical protein